MMATIYMTSKDIPTMEQINMERNNELAKLASSVNKMNKQLSQLVRILAP